MMSESGKPISMLLDFITGEPIPDIGAEANRQQVMRFLINEKKYLKTDIDRDVDIRLTIAGDLYHSQVDLVVGIDDNRKIMAIKCAAGSLGSREREILAASRLLLTYQIPLSVVSDGKTAIVLDTVSGRKIGEGLTVVPSKDEAVKRFGNAPFVPLPDERRNREMLIFRTYDVMNVNVARNL